MYTMPQETATDILQQPKDFFGVRKELIRLIVPMVFALLFMNSVGVVDTFFVSHLGNGALVAIGFTFPVTILITQLFIGYGVGTTSVISRANGAGEKLLVRRLIKHSMWLGVAAVSGVMALLLTQQKGIFLACGVSPKELPLACAYMTGWAYGMPFYFFTIWGTAVLRGLGKTGSSAAIFFMHAAINLALNPLLIFGIGPIQSLGIQGSGAATSIASLSSALVIGYLLAAHAKLRFADVSFQYFFASAFETLRIAVPAIINFSLVPITSAILTILLARNNGESVAAFGIVLRIESFITMVPLAIGGGLGPFVGKQWAMNQHQTLQQAVGWCLQLALLWGMAVTVLLVIFAFPIAQILASNSVVPMICSGLWIIPLGFASTSRLIITKAVYENIGWGGRSILLGGIRNLGLAVPFSVVGQYFFGTFGIFASLPLSAFVAERLAARWLVRDRLLLD